MTIDRTTRRRRSGPRAIVATLGLLATVGCQAADPATSSEAPWKEHLQQVDRALAAKDIGAAARALHDADTAARRSRQWEAVVAAGDAYRRLGGATGYAERARARELYVIALVWASRRGSVDGTLHTAAAFGGLGDREMAEQCLRVATTLAQVRHDLSGQQRIQAFREVWSRARRTPGDSEVQPTVFAGEPPGH
jgi:hypothetical protein